jgi:hypothetical protein
MTEIFSKRQSFGCTLYGTPRHYGLFLARAEMSPLSKWASRRPPTCHEARRCHGNERIDPGLNGNVSSDDVRREHARHELWKVVPDLGRVTEVHDASRYRPSFAPCVWRFPAAPVFIAMAEIAPHSLGDIEGFLVEHDLPLTARLRRGG